MKKLFSLFALLAGCAVAGAQTAPVAPDAATTLRARSVALQPQLQRSAFGRPMVLDSSETPERVTGDIHALIDHPFERVRAGLTQPDSWCELMLLHINTKYCRAAPQAGGTVLRVNIGKKTPVGLANAARFEFSWRVVASTPDYLDIALAAPNGPMGTSDYRLRVEAAALPNGKTVLHLSYSYGMNMLGQLAVQTYLSTAGRGKVGFTVPGGVRGMVERNAMRYYLAIDTWLQPATGTPAQQFEQHLQQWFTSSEQYPVQLHDIDRADYLEMKRGEYARQMQTP